MGYITANNLMCANLGLVPATVGEVGVDLRNFGNVDGDLMQRAQMRETEASASRGGMVVIEPDADVVDFTVDCTYRPGQKSVRQPTLWQDPNAMVCCAAPRSHIDGFTSAQIADAMIEQLPFDDVFSRAVVQLLQQCAGIYALTDGRPCNGMYPLSLMHKVNRLYYLYYNLALPVTQRVGYLRENALTGTGEGIDETCRSLCEICDDEVSEIAHEQVFPRLLSLCLHNANEANIEISASAKDGQHFAGRLISMYESFCSRNPEYNCDIIIGSETAFGTRSVTVCIRGPNALSLFQSESGVHKFESKSVKGSGRKKTGGKVHTQLVNVLVLPPIQMENGFTEGELEVSYYSGTGAGGMGRNAHQKCVRILHRPTGIITTGSNSRSKEGNFALARQRMIAALDRRAALQMRSERADLWAERPESSIVRSYEFDRGMVSERVHGEKREYQLVGFIAGNINESLTLAQQQLLLQAILNELEEMEGLG